MRRVVPGAAALGMALVLAGCGSDEETASAVDSSSSTSSVTIEGPAAVEAEPSTEELDADAETAAIEAEVLATVQGFWDTIVEAGDPPNPDHPGFERYFTGEALERSLGAIRGHEQRGEIARDSNGVMVESPEVVLDVVGYALVRHCFVDDGVLMDAEAEAVIDDSVVAYSVELRLAEVDGHWRVVTAKTLESDSEERSCA